VASSVEEWRRPDTWPTMGTPLIWRFLPVHCWTRVPSHIPRVFVSLIKFETAHRWLVLSTERRKAVAHGALATRPKHGKSAFGNPAGRRKKNGDLP